MQNVFAVDGGVLLIAGGQSEADRAALEWELETKRFSEKPLIFP